MDRAEIPPRPRLYAFLVVVSAAGAAFGFVREATVAALFGASRETDAYYVALSVPFVVSQFFVGGAFVPPLTVSFSRCLALGKRDEARALLGTSLRAILGWGAAAAVAAAFLAGPLMALLAPGFPAPDQLLAASLFRALLVYGVLTSVALAASAPLLAAGAWHLPPLAFLFANMVSVAFLFAFRGSGIAAAAWGLDAGAAVQAAVLLPFLARLGLLPTAGPSDTRLPLRESGLLLLSLLAAGAVDLAERPFASAAGVGAVAILTFASKLIHLPMRLVAAPLVSVAFPRLARRALRPAESPRSEARNVAIAIGVLLVAASAVVAFLAAPIVHIAFRRGRFGPGAAAGLVETLRYLSPAVFALGMIEVGSKFLLAEGRAPLVAVAQGVGLVSYLVAAPLLAHHGVNGLAGARALSWSIVALLLIGALAAPRLVRRHATG